MKFVPLKQNGMPLHRNQHAVVIGKGMPFRRNMRQSDKMANVDIVRLIIKELGKCKNLITYVTDRKSHNLRYAIDPTKIHEELGWQPGSTRSIMRKYTLIDK